jgi:DNA-binding transcriptional regulator YdaS (Cro superfamily)
MDQSAVIESPGVNETSAIAQACEHVGGQGELGRLLGVTPQAVHLWVRRGRCPADRVLAVEAATSGRISRHALRPDLYPAEPAAA